MFIYPMKCLCMFIFQSHASDVFEAYPLLVTEMVLRLTYQVKKIVHDSEKSELSEEWFTCLFEVVENNFYLYSRSLFYLFPCRF